MADVAFIFHWQPDYLLGLAHSRLYAWRERALARFNAANGGDE